MRNTKEILNERKTVEEKLTQAEIAYNKVNYEAKELQRSIKELEKESHRATPEHIEDYKARLAHKKEKLKGAEDKVEKLKSKKYEDRVLKKEIEKEEKNLSKKNADVKSINKRLKDLRSEKKAKDIEWMELWKSHIYDQKQKIARRKQKIKDLNKKIIKYESTPEHKYDSMIEKMKKELVGMQPEIDKRKEKVSKYKKQYKALQKEWSKLFPDEDDSVAISVKDLNIFYGKKQSIFNVNIDIPKNEVIAIIGPSGCGKSTFLKTLNRINDEIPIFRAEGNILFQNEVDILTLENIHDSSLKMTLPELRTKIGMVFQQPNPFPMSIFNNIAYGPRINGIKNKAVLKEIVDATLKKSALYEQVKDNLNAMATGLSGGQQQRLCIARAIANKPDILLMDEPTSALDPIAAKKVEDLILELKKDYTIIMVTHSMQQAARISDKTAFFYQGELIEYGDTKQIFNKPKEQKTSDYINGKFG